MIKSYSSSLKEKIMNVALFVLAGLGGIISITISLYMLLNMKKHEAKMVEDIRKKWEM